MIHIMRIIVLKPIMKRAGTNQFYNLYRLIPFDLRTRTERSFEHMRIMGMPKSNGLAPLFCVRTQLVIIIILIIITIIII